MSSSTSRDHIGSFMSLVPAFEHNQDVCDADKDNAVILYKVTRTAGYTEDDISKNTGANVFHQDSQATRSDEERHPNSFEVEDETDVYFLEQAYAYHEHLKEEENSPRLTRNPIHRDRKGAEEQ
nr:hypothetical protein [Tanacetum cinerariifolium]